MASDTSYNAYMITWMYLVFRPDIITFLTVGNLLGGVPLELLSNKKQQPCQRTLCLVRLNKHHILMKVEGLMIRTALIQRIPRTVSGITNLDLYTLQLKRLIILIKVALLILVLRKVTNAEVGIRKKERIRDQRGKQ